MLEFGGTKLLWEQCWSWKPVGVWWEGGSMVGVKNGFHFLDPHERQQNNNKVVIIQNRATRHSKLWGLRNACLSGNWTCQTCPKKPRGYLDSIDRKKLNDTVRTSTFARCHYMPKCEHHMIELQVVIKFLLLMYFLNDLCLASTNRTRDLWHELNDTTYEVYRCKLVHVDDTSFVVISL